MIIDEYFYLEKQPEHWIKRVYMIRILFVLQYDVLQGQDVITKTAFLKFDFEYFLGLPNSLENIIGHFNVNE